MTDGTEQRTTQDGSRSDAPTPDAPPATEREVADAEGTAWRCVQAFAGLGASAAAQAAAERAASGAGQVAVVATPSGGAQSVRLELPVDWASTLSDEALRSAIDRAR